MQIAQARLRKRFSCARELAEEVNPLNGDPARRAEFERWLREHPAP